MPGHDIKVGEVGGGGEGKVGSKFNVTMMPLAFTSLTNHDFDNKVDYQSALCMEERTLTV